MLHMSTKSPCPLKLGPFSYNVAQLLLALLILRLLSNLNDTMIGKKLGWWPLGHPMRGLWLPNLSYLVLNYPSPLSFSFWPPGSFVLPIDSLLAFRDSVPSTAIPDLCWQANAYFYPTLNRRCLHSSIMLFSQQFASRNILILCITM